MYDGWLNSSSVGPMTYYTRYDIYHTRGPHKSGDLDSQSEKKDEHNVQNYIYHPLNPLTYNFGAKF